VADDPRDPGHVPIDPDLEPTDPAEPAIGHRPSREVHPRRARPDVLAAIALGGALGAPARYGVTKLIQPPSGTFPWDILWVNISGSLVLGVFLVVVIERLPPSRYLRPFFAVGFLGAYTTYSTYMVGASLLVKDGHVGTALAYLVGSAVAGFAAVWIGIAGGRLLPITSKVGS
jgi:CrcB protein